jgi:hypothetical protein
MGTPGTTRSICTGAGDRNGDRSAFFGVANFFAERSSISVASRAASLSNEDVVALTVGDGALFRTTGLSAAPASLKFSPRP